MKLQHGKECSCCNMAHNVSDKYFILISLLKLLHVQLKLFQSLNDKLEVVSRGSGIE